MGEKIEIPAVPKPMFWGREMQQQKADIALRVLKRKAEMQQMFSKYVMSEAEELRIAAAEAKRSRKAMKRIKERGNG